MTDTSSASLLKMSLLPFEIFCSDFMERISVLLRIFLIFQCNNKNKSHSFRKNTNLTLFVLKPYFSTRLRNLSDSFLSKKLLPHRQNIYFINKKLTLTFLMHKYYKIKGFRRKFKES